MLVSEGLRAILVTLLAANVDQDNPEFNVIESNNSQQIIITSTTFNKLDVIYQQLMYVFRSPEYTLQHIPFQLRIASSSKEDSPDSTSTHVLGKSYIAPPQFNLVHDQFNLSTLPEIRVNKLHFIAYMSTLLEHGILLCPNANKQLNPIVFNNYCATQSTMLIEFGIDCSGSMAAVFPRLKEILSTIVTELYQTLNINTTQIRLAPFASKHHIFEIMQFSLSESPQLLKAINDLEIVSNNTGTINEQTAIYQFLEHKYRSFMMFRELDEYDVVSVLLSDGVDNDSEARYRPNPTNSDQLSRTLQSIKKTLRPPQFFSIEIGNVHNATLTTINSITNGVRIVADLDLKNLNIFFEQIKNLAAQQYSLKFTQAIPVIGREKQPINYQTFEIRTFNGQFIKIKENHHLNPNVPVHISGINYSIIPNTKPIAKIPTTTSKPIKIKQSESQRTAKSHSPINNHPLYFSPCNNPLCFSTTFLDNLEYGLGRKSGILAKTKYDKEENYFDQKKIFTPPRFIITA